MNRLEDMQIFAEAVECSNFSEAARRLGLSKQYVSFRIGVLEERLGVRLLNRTTRKLSLTDVGLQYYEKIKLLVSAADEADHFVSTYALTPKGRLRLAAPVSYGLQILPGVISTFLSRYPEVEVDLDLNDRVVDLIGESYDMAIRVGVLADSSLIARKINATRLLTVASPAYLAMHDAPKTPADLSSHTCLMYGQGRPVDWWYEVDGKTKPVAVQGRMRANNGDILSLVTINGLGIAQLPNFIVDSAIADGRLVEVLDAFKPKLGAAYTVYPQHRQSNTLVKAFSDLLCGIDDD